MTIDKHQLYGAFLQSHERQQRLSDLATRKALDLPLDDDVNITQTTTNHAPSLASLLVLAGGLLAGGTGIGIGLPTILEALSSADPSPVPAIEQQAAVPAPASEYRVTFYAEDGRPIEVDRTQPLPHKEQTP